MARHIDPDWLRERYPRMTSVERLLDDHEREFGWRPTKSSLYMRAYRLGIKKAPVTGRDGRAERPIRWSREPDLDAWMLEHDTGQRLDELQREFREAWGFTVSRGQVNAFRASHGRSGRKSSGGRPRVPVGTERESKDGYLVVKVADAATRPMSKDNWRLKHVWVWEQAHGPLPDGHCVYFADGDRRNFEPSNLVAVDRRLVGIMNQLRSEGVTWNDAESLEVAVNMARLKSARKDLAASRPRTCPLCGRTFDNRSRRSTSVEAATCPDCIAAGRRPPRRGRATTYDHAQIRALHATGKTNAEVARLVGCSPSTVHDVLARRPSDEAAGEEVEGED